MFKGIFFEIILFTILFVNLNKRIFAVINKKHENIQIRIKTEFTNF